MQNRINITFNVDIVCDVVVYEMKVRVACQMSDVIGISCHQIIDCNNLMTLSNKAITKV